MNSIKKLGILKTGEVKDEWQNQFGDYSTMFARLFYRIAPHLKFTVFNVAKEEYPSKPESYDGYIITGSRHGVYEDLAWIDALFKQIRSISDRGIPQAGICFGHQALTTAFGGKVLKSDKGWGVGAHDYRVDTRTNGFDGILKEGERFTLLATHQDQVLEAPKDANVLATSDFCPIAGLISHQKRFISFQGHPEFTKEFHNKLLNYRIKDIGKETAANARLTLSKKTDETKIARSILKFFELQQEKKNA